MQYLNPSSNPFARSTYWGGVAGASVGLVAGVSMWQSISLTAVCLPVMAKCLGGSPAEVNKTVDTSAKILSAGSRFILGATFGGAAIGASVFLAAHASLYGVRRLWRSAIHD